MGGSSLRGLVILLLLFFATCSYFDTCDARSGRHWRGKSDLTSSLAKKKTKGKSSGNSHHHHSPSPSPKPSPDPKPKPSPPPKHSPTPKPSPSPTPSPPAPQGTTFNVLDFGAKGDGTTDDTKAFLNTWLAACKVVASTVVVPSNFQFLVGPISFAGPNCQPNIVFQLDGTIVAPTSPKPWGSGLLQWLEFTKLKGLTIQGQGIIEGQGSSWWHKNSELDENPELDTELMGGMPNIRPTALRFYGSTNVTVSGITIQNSPQFHLKFDSCQAVVVHGITVSSPGDSPNTDGIHLQNSVGVTIHHSDLACGDDCISIQTGCSNVYIHDVNCGPGHGISIGGLGKDNSQAIVSDITIQDVKITKTMTAIRIKTWQGGSGSVKNIRYTNVQVSEVQTPIVINQFYCDQSKCKNQTSAVALSDITYQGIIGTYTVQPVYLACSDSTPCSNIHLADIELQPVEENHHMYDSFCWKAYGDVQAPTEPPISCLESGNP
ncbi:polygalacturonase At1g48100-like isoform X1 [Typha latifolia]|uniref:polygalacturonase At1g48100-like isoform X1 n=1 Tax=Typha latifolia TaxID=4733 RepID=UPI003C2D0E86